ncbi:hypothetical protein ACFQZX_05305 [Mucilaginibacter litoreus]|uniref:Uncharacterized protein n=1 Tax=Mucilaginibacter litoreus TaxID=1048221 RepID=A0ABW3APQ6_9SPHI
MRTSLNNIKETDDYLLGLLSAPNALVFEARMLIDAQLQEQAALHKQTHSLIQQYGRARLRADIEAVHTQLFNQPEHSSFRQRILRLFKG